MADKHIQRPIGLLERVLVTTYEIEYEHTFAVIDFGQNPNYNVILGRTFTRQLKMIQDWGFDYIYLWQDTSITRVNMRNHSFKDVAKTPIEDFESATTSYVKPSWIGKPNYLWMCGTLESGDQKEREGKESELNDYILEPFSKHKFEPLRWTDVLAIVTISVNDITSTLFCDEEGYDIIPVQMVNVLNILEENNLNPKLLIEPTIEVNVNHVKIENEVSTFDLSFEQETQGEKYHDALDELDELDALEIDGTKTYSIVFKTKERAKLAKPLRLMHIQELMTWLKGCSRMSILSVML